VLVGGTGVAVGATGVAVAGTGVLVVGAADRVGAGVVGSSVPVTLDVGISVGLGDRVSVAGVPVSVGGVVPVTLDVGTSVGLGCGD
jgi:hypothetical protein